MNKPINGFVLSLALFAVSGHAATVNVGAVANSTTTGQYLSVAGTTTTTGLIKVGFFSGKSFVDIQGVISGWSINTPATTYDAYSAINSLFTQVGTTINPSSSGGTLGGTAGGLYSTAGSGWNFSSSGNVSGTANYVDLALAPQGTKMYVWAFNGSNFTSSGFDSTQWALVSGSAWTLPGSGGLSMVLNTITSQSNDVLLGTDNGNNLNMVAIIPEPSSLQLITLGLVAALSFRRKSSKFTWKAERLGKINSKIVQASSAMMIALLASVHAQTTVSTPIVGFSKLSVPVGGRLMAPVFSKPSIYQGSATVNSGVLTVSGLTSGALNQTSYSDRPNFPTHYVKILSSGVYQGLILDIVSNTSTSITVAGAPAGLSGTITMLVAPHYTLKDLADTSTSLTPYFDLVTFYDSGSNKRSYYYTGDSNGFISDDYSTPANNVVIYPGSGVILNTSATASVTMSGNVNTTQTIVPIYAGESIVAPIDPSGVSKVAGINLAASLSPYSDLANMVLLDGSLATSSYYSDGTNILDESYSTVPLASSPAVSSGNGFIVNAVSDTQWIQPPVVTQ